MAFKRTISRVSHNNISFDIYENKNGTATIRPCKLGHDFPNKKWVKFDSLELLEKWIEEKEVLWGLDEKQDGFQFVGELKRVLLNSSYDMS